MVQKQRHQEHLSMHVKELEAYGCLQMGSEMNCKSILLSSDLVPYFIWQEIFFVLCVAFTKSSGVKKTVEKNELLVAFLFATFFNPNL